MDSYHLIHGRRRFTWDWAPISPHTQETTGIAIPHDHWDGISIRQTNDKLTPSHNNIEIIFGFRLYSYILFICNSILYIFIVRSSNRSCLAGNVLVQEHEERMDKKLCLVFDPLFELFQIFCVFFYYLLIFSAGEQKWVRGLTAFWIWFFFGKSISPISWGKKTKEKRRTIIKDFFEICQTDCV